MANKIEGAAEPDLLRQHDAQFGMLARDEIGQDADTDPAEAPPQLHDEAVRGQRRLGFAAAVLVVALYVWVRSRSAKV